MRTEKLSSLVKSSRYVSNDSMRDEWLWRHFKDQKKDISKQYVPSEKASSGHVDRLTWSKQPLRPISRSEGDIEKAQKSTKMKNVNSGKGPGGNHWRHGNELVSNDFVRRHNTPTPILSKLNREKLRDLGVGRNYSKVDKLNEQVTSLLQNAARTMPRSAASVSYNTSKGTEKLNPKPLCREAESVYSPSPRPTSTRGVKENHMDVHKMILKLSETFELQSMVTLKAGPCDDVSNNFQRQLGNTFIIPRELACLSDTVEHILLCSGPFREGRTGVIHFPTISVQVLSEVIRFLCHSFLEIRRKEHASEISSHFSPMPKMQDYQIRNAGCLFELIDAAIYLNLKDLCEWCFTYAASNIKSIEDFNVLSELMTARILSKVDIEGLTWAERNCDESQVVIIDNAWIQRYRHIDPSYPALFFATARETCIQHYILKQLSLRRLLNPDFLFDMVKNEFRKSNSLLLTCTEGSVGIFEKILDFCYSNQTFCSLCVDFKNIPTTQHVSVLSNIANPSHSIPIQEREHRLQSRLEITPDDFKLCRMDNETDIPDSSTVHILLQHPNELRDATWARLQGYYQIGLLHCLCLSSIVIDETNVTFMCQMIHGAGQLARLALHQVTFRGSFCVNKMGEGVSSKISLSDLVVSSPIVEDCGREVLFSMLQKLLTRNKFITSFKLSGISVSPSEITKLLLAIERNNRLQHLDLSDCKLPVTITSFLAKTIEKNESLLTVSLKDNGLSSKSLHILINSLFDRGIVMEKCMLSGNMFNPECLDLFLRHELCPLQYLTHVEIDGYPGANTESSLTDAQVPLISELLNGPCIKYLSLSYHDITDEGLYQIFVSLSSRPQGRKHLCLRNNLIQKQSLLTKLQNAGIEEIQNPFDRTSWATAICKLISIDVSDPRTPPPLQSCSNIRNAKKRLLLENIRHLARLTFSSTDVGWFSVK